MGDPIYPPKPYSRLMKLTPSTVPKENNTEPAAIRTWVNGRLIYIELTDGRIIGFPADRFKLLSQATDEQLTRVQLRLNGFPEPFFPHFPLLPASPGQP